MRSAGAASTIAPMRPSDRPKRYRLVAAADTAPPPEEEAERPRVRRYSLARVAVSPRSALGEDWHRRLEDAAERRP